MVGGINYMVNDIERYNFWFLETKQMPLPEKGKIKILKCSQEKFWYKNNIGDVFDIEYESARDYYIKKPNGRLIGVLIVDSEKI